MTNINLPLTDELLDQIDVKRGDVPRTVWIRRAIEEGLERARAPRPEIRSSDSIKRDIKPILKGDKKK